MGVRFTREYHVEAYGIESSFNGGGLVDTELEAEDYRVLGGFKMDGGYYNWFIEGGLVFDRQVRFANVGHRATISPVALSARSAFASDLILVLTDANSLMHAKPEACFSTAKRVGSTLINVIAISSLTPEEYLS
ncbi:MAG: hypothetical protein U0936_01530 [Planctomycetaceae bacterium]